MHKIEKEYTPEQNKLYDMVRDDIRDVYRNISEHQALNAAIYAIIDNEGNMADPNDQAIINNVISLINLQEERFAVLTNNVDNVVSKLFELINPDTKEEMSQK